MTEKLKKLLALQKQHSELGSVHLVDVGEMFFSLAHTDQERASGDDLTECSVHQWLRTLDGPPAAPGIYIVRPIENAGPSVSFRSDAQPFELEPFSEQPS